jgi:hypothetical protein
VSKGTGRRPARVTFDGACTELAGLLSGGARREIVDRLLEAGGAEDALARLRAAMRSHTLPRRDGSLRLQRMVESFDRHTRRDGFHVLKEWDHSSQRFIDEDIPVLMLDYFGRAHLGALPLRAALSLLLDYYLLYVLALVLTRAWDEGDVAANLDRISALLDDLQGPQGSGHRFVDDAAGLLFVAVSHYEPDDLAYHRLLDRVWELGMGSRLAVARVTGPLFGCHLRWGFAALYAHDVRLMRDDNFSDYPWVLFSVATLVEEYAAADPTNTGRRARAAADLLGALSPDPDAFLGEPPAALAEYAPWHERARGLLHRHRDELLADFERWRPRQHAYSPLALVFNFPHNVLIATVVLGLLGERVPNVSLSALLASDTAAASERTRELDLALLLTRYAASNPSRQRGRPVLMIAYDPAAGLAAWERTMEALRHAPRHPPEK